MAPKALWSSLLFMTLACTNRPPGTGTDTTTESSAGESDSAGSETGGDPLAGVERDEGSYHNFDQGIQCVFSETLRPDSVEEVQSVVRWAADQSLRIRAVSTLLSHSENATICPSSEGIQINVSQMNDILEIDAEAGTVKVEPGVQMGDLGDALAAEDRALRIILPLRDFTAAGLLGTGAHNSSLRYPAGIHDMVVGLELVDARGELVSLNGAEAKRAAAHLGLLGVVVSVTFETLPQYKTAYALQKGDDIDLEDQILDLAAAHDYASFSWFPASGGYTMSTHDIVPIDTPGDAYSTGWHSTAAEQLGFADLAEMLNNDPNGEETICNVESFRYEDKQIGHQQDGIIVEEPVGLSHRMFASTCVDLECPWHAGNQAFNPELAIPVEQLPAWMTRVREIIAAKTTCFPVNGIVIRFSTASQSLMGSNAGRDVAYVEWHIARNRTPGKHEHFSGMYDEIFQMSLAEFESRPHWGKNYWSTFNALSRDLYPGWDEFDALRAQLDPEGLFVNDFFRSTYGEIPIEHSPQCAIDRSCICEDDSHCGDDHQCLPGLVFSDARVCR